MKIERGKLVFKCPKCGTGFHNQLASFQYKCGNERCSFLCEPWDIWQHYKVVYEMTFEDRHEFAMERNKVDALNKVVK